MHMNFSNQAGAANGPGNPLGTDGGGVLETTSPFAPDWSPTMSERRRRGELQVHREGVRRQAFRRERLRDQLDDMPRSPGSSDSDQDEHRYQARLAPDSGIQTKIGGTIRLSQPGAVDLRRPSCRVLHGFPALQGALLTFVLGQLAVGLHGLVALATRV
eukprot:COSAG06_NODE_63_length_26848_cov_29.983476_18_plen_159_part_00